jgi:hypothetical protein
MSSSKPSSILIGAVVMVAVGIGAPAAHAFNPQPDPPARVKKNADKTWKYNNSIFQPGNSGLLNNGSGFSTQPPSSVGTPIGGGARGGGAGTR